MNLTQFAKEPIVFIVVILFFVVVFFALIFIPFLWKKDTSKAREKAFHMAQKKWYIKDYFLHKSGSAILLIYSEGQKREKIKLVFRPHHPSIKAIRNLWYLDIVEFEFQDKPLECALESELCAYLKVKSSYHFS